MYQKKYICLSCLVCIIILVFLAALGRMTIKEEKVHFAQNYEELQISINYPTETEQINIWKDEDYYYFFLPASIGKDKISFRNLQQEDSIMIGGHTYHQKDNIRDEIVFDTVCDMQLTVAGEVLPKQQVIFMQSENIPALFIEMESGTVEYIHDDKTKKEKARMSLINAQGGCEYKGDIEYIKARGNSTFYEVDKKAYQIKLLHKQSLLGMKKEKKWLLLANALDDSLLRNKLVYDFASKYTEVSSIDGKYVDLYINGDYLGNYFLCEKVEVSKNRLDITDLEEKNETVNSSAAIQSAEPYVSEDGSIKGLAGLKNAPDITGGYLLVKGGAGKCAFVTNSGQQYSVVSPENATLEQVEYICNLFNEMELAISQPDGINPNTGKHFSEYMDMDSWISKFLIDEVFQDADSPYASTYFYKNSDNVDTLIYSGPVWDYDRVLGGYNRDPFYIDDPLQFGYRGVYAEELLQHEEVLELVIDKYQKIFVPYIENEFSGQIESLQKEIAASAKMNKIRWKQVQGYFEDFDANGDYLKSFLKKRMEYLNGIWLEEQQYHTVTFLDYYGGVYDQYLVKHGDYLTTPPYITTYVAIFNGWYSTTSGKALQTRLPVLEDVTYESRWIDVSILLQNGISIAELDPENVDIHAIEILVDELKRQQEDNP